MPRVKNDDINQLSEATLTFNTWNTEQGKTHKLFNVVGNALQGKAVGHASAVIEMPVNDYTKGLIDKYCINQQKEELIPYLIAARGQGSNLKFNYIIDMSWWPKSVDTSDPGAKVTMRTFDDDLVREASAHNIKDKRKNVSHKFDSFKINKETQSPLVFPPAKEIEILPNSAVHSIWEKAYMERVDQMKLIHASLLDVLKNMSEDIDEITKKTVEDELALLEKILRDCPTIYQRETAFGLSPDTSVSLSLKSPENPLGFDVEKILKKMNKYITTAGYTLMTNCSTTIYEALKAGAPDELKHNFNTSVFKTGIVSKLVMTPQILDNMVHEYQNELININRDKAIQSKNIK